MWRPTWELVSCNFYIVQSLNVLTQTRIHNFLENTIQSKKTTKNFWRPIVFSNLRCPDGLYILNLKPNLNTESIFTIYKK